MTLDEKYKHAAKIINSLDGYDTDRILASLEIWLEGQSKREAINHWRARDAYKDVLRKIAELKGGKR